MNADVLHKLSLSGRNANDAFGAPTGEPSRYENVGRMAGYFRPFTQEHRFALRGQGHVAASISGLFGFRRPPHIAGFVVTIIVDAVKGMFCRRLGTHVLQKFGKRLEIKLDTSATIIVIRGIGGRITSTLRRVITVVFGGSRPAVCFSSFPRLLISHTSARRCMAARQVATADNAQLAAFTFTLPHCASAFRSPSVSNNGQVAELLAGQIAEQSVRRFWLKFHNTHYNTSANINATEKREGLK